MLGRLLPFQRKSERALKDEAKLTESEGGESVEAALKELGKAAGAEKKREIGRGLAAANDDSITEETGKASIGPEKITYEAAPPAVQKALKPLSEAQRKEVEIFKVGENQYHLLLAGPAASSLVLSGFKKALAAINPFKALLPTQVTNELHETALEKSDLIQRLKEDSVRMQVLLKVPENNKKAELEAISITGSPYDTRYLTNKDTRGALGKAVSEILEKSESKSGKAEIQLGDEFRTDLKTLKAALALKDEKKILTALQPLLERMSRTYTLDELKIDNPANGTPILKPEISSLLRRNELKGGEGTTLVLKGKVNAEENFTTSILEGISVPARSMQGQASGKPYLAIDLIGGAAMTVINQNPKVSTPLAVLLSTANMYEYSNANAQMSTKAKNALSEALVKNTLAALKAETIKPVGRMGKVTEAGVEPEALAA